MLHQLIDNDACLVVRHSVVATLDGMGLPRKKKQVSLQVPPWAVQVTSNGLVVWWDAED